MAVLSKRAYNWYAAIVAATCMVLYGFDAAVFNACQSIPAWVTYFGKPTDSQLGTVNSVYIIGNIIAGFFFAPPISNMFGRRAAMGVGCVFVIGATILQAWSPRNIGGFMGGRFLVGVGQGIALPAGATYISEVARSDVRGKMMSFWQMFYSIGAFIAFWIAYATSKHTASLGNWAWRLIVVFQLLCPLVVIPQLFFIPESPRWYVSKGRIDDARTTLYRIRDGEEEAEAELLMMREAMEFEKKELNSSGLRVYKLFWTDKSLRWRFFLALVINAGQQLTGQGSLVSYSSKVYAKVFTSTTTVTLINALNATFGIVFTLNATWMLDRFGRKWLLCVGAIGQALCMIIVATVYITTPTLGNAVAGIGAKSEPVGVSIVFLLFLFILFYKPSWGATVWVFTSEIFSMNVRMYAVGMASQTQNITNVIVNQFFPQLLTAINFKAFYIFGGINILLFLFVFFLVPETKGVPLEEMDVLFGGKDHVQAGADILGIEAPSDSGSIGKGSPVHYENKATV